MSETSIAGALLLLIGAFLSTSASAGEIVIPWDELEGVYRTDTYPPSGGYFEFIPDFDVTQVVAASLLVRGVTNGGVAECTGGSWYVVKPDIWMLVRNGGGLDIYTLGFTPIENGPFSVEFTLEPQGSPIGESTATAWDWLLDGNAEVFSTLNSIVTLRGCWITISPEVHLLEVELHLSQSSVPLDKTSWGRVKALYSSR